MVDSSPSTDQDPNSSPTNPGETGSATTSSHPLQSSGANSPRFVIRTANATYSEHGRKSSDDDPPQSVIHAPSGFKEFIFAASPTSPPPLMTSIAPMPDWSERATPRAQTMEDFEKINTRTYLNLEDQLDSGLDGNEVPEVGETLKRLDSVFEVLPEAEAELRALKAALAECWSLCNTLAGLGRIHKTRSSQKAGAEEEAWTSCWKLCQELYDNQNVDYASQVTPTLDLCREFCQTLFNARVSDSEAADSVLRVSFELNNHLYNTHDRNLPDAFRERTLDFYITLCHRLMKQRSLSSEADTLLSACWSLAEMLFSIRQNKTKKKPLDEELLGAAVQACWELCDIFREGWSRLRLVDSITTPRRSRSLRDSDRGTPRPRQVPFKHAVQDVPQPEQSRDGALGNPETPTTIFEETATTTPDDIPIQNIFILGQESSQASHPAWSSNSSNVSVPTQSSGQTSSTNTVTIMKNDTNLMSLKVLVTKAAMISGFRRNGSQSMSSFVKSLSSDAFGSTSWQVSLLKNYKRLVAFDPVFRVVASPGEASAVDVAKAVQTMTRSGKYFWLRDLYRFVLGFHTEEAINRSGFMLQA
ncbi:hypothetical protein FE257_004362 [Aspergillus nanangensis]|uniref:DUF7624 domain-containing protein n=1 Tax=Aspergillus nanangensis TaxID=2582783 RepID=A0AAD4CBY3_ASPNN|nr:hypothetical protein FE257_004362 [Aspergillus nanangensis]